MTAFAPGLKPYRRPLLILAASLLLFLGALGLQLSKDAESAASSPPPAPLERSSEAMLRRFQQRLQRNPEDSFAYAQLGLSYLQRLRETGDASLVVKAEAALAEALKHDPDQFDAILGEGLLALSRHDFHAALRWGQRARALSPFSSEALGILVDAQVELGRYDAAVATAQAMVDLRPDLASYSRVSYLRELHGDVAGAIAAMRSAAAASVVGSEANLWAQTQLGHLYFNSGDLEQAEQAYRQALTARPDYPFAQAGLGRVRAAQGRIDEALALYRPLVARLPLPEFAIALGELYQTSGRALEAQQQYDLVRAIHRLQAGAGVNVDAEAALFEADHGSDAEGTVAQARAAYQLRPSLFAADVLAWALYQAGDFEQAQRYSQEALRLGTQEALWHFHAGMIAHALGDEAAAAEQMRAALAINPHFSLSYAPAARAILANSDN
jgi:tetratricopeptide (TPR) repeat protein